MQVQRYGASFCLLEGATAEVSEGNRGFEKGSRSGVLQARFQKGCSGF